jgi:hypothetical protein
MVNKILAVNKRKHYFSVCMSYSECEDLYRHQIKYLVVNSNEGVRIRLPKQNMQKFVKPSGLHGNFELIIDQNNKIKSISIRS